MLPLVTRSRVATLACCLQVAGVDLEGLLKQAKGEGWDPTKPVLDFDSAGDRIEIFLEFK